MTIAFTKTTRVDCTEFVSFAIEKKTFNRMEENFNVNTIWILSYVPWLVGSEGRAKGSGDFDT